MQQEVQIARVYPDGSADVFVQRQSACSGDCHKCSGCGAAQQQVFVRAKNPIGAVPGDRVVVRSSDRQVLSAMAVVYLLPLALLLCGYFVGYALALAPGLFAAAGFALGMIAVLAYHRYVQRKRPVVYVITGYAV